MFFGNIGGLFNQNQPDTPQPCISYVLKVALLCQILIMVLSFILLGMENIFFDIFSALLIALMLYLGWKGLSLRIVSFYSLYCLFYAIWDILMIYLLIRYVQSEKTPTHFTIFPQKRSTSVFGKQIAYYAVVLVYRIVMLILLPRVFTTYEDIKFGGGGGGNLQAGQAASQPVYNNNRNNIATLARQPSSVPNQIAFQGAGRRMDDD